MASLHAGSDSDAPTGTGSYGGAFVKAESPHANSSDSAGAEQNSLWDTRYANEGFLWGERPGPASDILIGAITMLKATDAQTQLRILDFGTGYGRDAVHFANNGFVAVGIDESPVGLELAEQLRRKAQKSDDRNGYAIFQRGDIGTMKSYPTGSFDAVFSHRTLHLLKPNTLKSFATQAARLLQPDGILCISARSFKDFNPEQMRWLPGQENKAAEYTLEGRKGHIVNFFDKDRFSKLFGPHFDILSFTEGHEMESLTNPRPSMLLTMLARAKANPALAKN